MHTIHVTPTENPSDHPPPTLCGSGVNWLGQFQAMASECDVLIEGLSQEDALVAVKLAAIEAWRIEYKYSRYRSDNIMASINNSQGKTIEVDIETSALLNFSEQCYQLSAGLFDISSGVLRKIWHFDGSDNIPSQTDIQSTLKSIGWSKVQWSSPTLCLKHKMELDLGGIGKEYAVDKVKQSIDLLAASLPSFAFLINFGGDLACSGTRLNGQNWEVAVESIKKSDSVDAKVNLNNGAIATSGDSQRYLEKDGIRYSHILNPKTGMSVANAPRSISVAANTCMQAGMLSTIAMLQGADAEAFLDAQEVQYWIQRK